MEIDDFPKRRWPAMVLLGSWGLILVGGLIAVVVYAARAAADDPDTDKSYHLWLALVAVVLLAMTLVVWVWMLLHRASVRSRQAKRAGPTKYVNAWQLAGERFRLDEEDDESHGDQDQPPDAGS